MADYYRLVSDYKALSVYIKQRSNLGRKFAIGRGKKLARVPDEPFIFDVEVEQDEDTPDASMPIPDYSSAGPTFNVELVQRMQAVGVDNLETFPAILVNGRTGEEVRDRYVAVNVIGLVACAVAESSTSTRLAGTDYFHELKIDPTKAMDLL